LFVNNTYSEMPQINPINWLILFLYFSSILIGCVVKLHFSKLRAQESLTEVKDVAGVKNFSVTV